MQLMCLVKHFPEPFQDVYCCQKTAECECPHRMGVCAYDADSTSMPLYEDELKENRVDEDSSNPRPLYGDELKSNRVDDDSDCNTADPI